MTAATDSRPSQRASIASTRAREAVTDSSPPIPASFRATIRLRRHTIRAPSSSESAPATQAAAISPCECPTTAAGSTPSDRHIWANEIITAHSAGCTTSSPSSAGAPGAPRSTSTSDQSTNGANALSHRVTQSANTGEVSSSALPIPAHCEPCPAKTITTLRPSAAASAPPTTPAAGRPSAAARSRGTSSSRSRPTTTSRWSNAVRSATSDRPTSTAPRSGRSSSHDTRFAACVRAAAADFADRTQGTTAGPPPVGPTGSTAGACSRTTCAFVPLIPNDDTPQRRGPSPPAHSRCSASRATPEVQSTSGVGEATCSVLGSTPCRSASTILMTPTTPEAPWVWPTFDLTEPIHSGSSAVRPSP